MTQKRPRHPRSVEAGVEQEDGFNEGEGEDRQDAAPGGRRAEQPAGHPRRLRVALRDRLRPEDVHQAAFTASMIRRSASPSRATSTMVPVTTTSAPAVATAFAAAAVRMPPPPTTGMSIASRTARSTFAGTGSGDPLPGSR